MRIRIEGKLPIGVTAKDLILAVIGKIGTAGGTGHVIEYAGEAISRLSMEGRMTVCNMSIEAGARAGLIAPDETTYAYLQGRPMAPKGGAWEQALAYWRTLPSDQGALYDKEFAIDAAEIVPQVTWGTSPEAVLPITGTVPDPEVEADEDRRRAMQRALDYMGLTPGTPLKEIKIDRVFIGSCTNGRIEDLRAVAEVAKGRKVGALGAGDGRAGLGAGEATRPRRRGSTASSARPGFDWREPGCSMCLAMNPDRLEPGERCASTSNRNFEGRQGRGGRTHLVSPAMAAAAAVAGRLADVREIV